MDNDAIRERLANVQRVKDMSLSLDSHHLTCFFTNETEMG
jgi:hypothetical protein